MKIGARKVLKRLREFTGKLLSFLENPSFLATVIVVSAFIIALFMRIAPSRWGLYLNEFDPYYEYYLAEKVLEKGGGDVIKGITWWFQGLFTVEKDPLFWAPWGRDLRRTSQPGSPIFTVLIYSALRGLGFKVSLMQVFAYLPAVGAAFSVFPMYFLGKRLHSREAGALAAFFMALSGAFLLRTNFGAKHEGIAIPFFLLAAYMFIRAYEKKSVPTAVLAGIFMGGMVFSWGGFIYAWNLFALIAIIWLFYKPNDITMAKVYLALNLVTQFFITISPRYRFEYAFLSHMAVLPMVANLMAVLSLASILGPARRMARERWTYVLAAVAIGAGLIVLAEVKIMGRALSVILPWLRPTYITTVAEHAIPTWSQVYGDLQTLNLLALPAAFIMSRRKDLKSLFLLLFWLSTLYAAASLVRLILLYAPAVALLGSIGFVEAMRAVGSFASEAAKAKRRPAPVLEVSVLAGLILIIVLIPPIAGALDARRGALAYSVEPPIILKSSVGIGVNNDWLSALEWIKENVPTDSTVAEWWDYGYWISVNTRRRSVADNGTLNLTQIRLIARAFLSDEETALKIFRSLGAEYVVVFEPFYPVAQQPMGIQVYASLAVGGFGGDFVKSIQMARWIGEDPDKYQEVVFIESGGVRIPVAVPKDTPEARNATLYKLLFTKTDKRLFFVFEPTISKTIQGYQGPQVEITPPKYFKLVYASEPNNWVLVFKINYPEEGSG